MKTMLLTLAVSVNLQAATIYQCNGKEVTKAQAAKTLQSNKSAKCMKVTDITFDDEKIAYRDWETDRKSVV